MSGPTVLDEVQAAARFGGSGTGVTRFAWTTELQAVSEWLGERLRELGLGVEFDPAGNVLGKWQAGAGKAVLVASHLDTVPAGGRYDGALGVLSGLHAIRLLKQRGIEPRRPVWLAAWTDEEGARFGTSMLGSRAFVGDDLRGLGDRRDAAGGTLREAMRTAGFDFDRLPEARGVDQVAAYLELHIEQGPCLEEAEADIGIVTEIVGLVSLRVTLRGDANHAGTTPMDRRRDALVGAARIAVGLRDEARSRPGMTANVGTIRVEPGGSNVIPGVCEFTIDVRSPGPEGYRQVESFARDLLERVAAEEGLGLEVRERTRHDPIPLDPELQSALERAAELEGTRTVRLPSRAAHDAMVLAQHVPAVMLFVPSRGGRSHSPDEFTEDRHCELGARVLARALELLVR